MEYKFKAKWDENTDIAWWRTSRMELNKIINFYNQWQQEDNFDVTKARLLLSKIEYGKQTIGSQDGGGGYMEALEEMEQFVHRCISNTVGIDSLPSREDILEPIQNALYATGRMETDICTDVASGILDYLSESGFEVHRRQLT